MTRWRWWRWRCWWWQQKGHGRGGRYHVRENTSAQKTIKLLCALSPSAVFPPLKSLLRVHNETLRFFYANRQHICHMMPMSVMTTMLMFGRDTFFTACTQAIRDSTRRACYWVWYCFLRQSLMCAQRARTWKNTYRWMYANNTTCKSTLKVTLITDT